MLIENEKSSDPAWERVVSNEETNVRATYFVKIFKGNNPKKVERN